MKLMGGGQAEEFKVAAPQDVQEEDGEEALLKQLYVSKHSLFKNLRQGTLSHKTIFINIMTGNV